MELNILKRREEYGLNLRKEKIFQHIMEKRLANRTFSEKQDYNINQEQLNVSDQIKESFNSAVRLIISHTESRREDGFYNKMALRGRPSISIQCDE